MWGSHAYGLPNFYLFIAFFGLTFLVCLPKYVLAPLNFFYAYYGLWFVLAPCFAVIYQDGVLVLPEYRQALAMAFTVFGLGVISIVLGNNFGGSLNCALGHVQTPERLRIPIAVLFIFSSLMIYLIVAFSGGLSVWVDDPGQAFLNRGGTGVYVVLSHFSSTALAAACGFYAYMSKRKWPVLLFLLWLILTAPVHGSKLQISLLAIVLFLPWLRDARLFSLKSVALYCAFVAIFFLGMVFRGVEVDQIIPGIRWILNYFTVLENLAMSVRDFEPGFLTTFFLPFVKFLTPFGLEDPKMYFDMNHMLTDHYYPERWVTRATEQWPVETDLYLNFYFFAGLPLVAFYLFMVSAVFSYARKSETLGAWVASILLTIGMISHLRGSLYNHIDFYMYPYIFVVYMVFKKYSFRHVNGAT